MTLHYLHQFLTFGATPGGTMVIQEQGMRWPGFERFKALHRGNGEPELFMDGRLRACWADRSRLTTAQMAEMPAGDLAAVLTVCKRGRATALDAGGRELRL